MRFIYHITLIFAVFGAISPEIVKVKNGVLKGVLGNTKNGRIIRKFYGIPYAEPPIGNLRFKPPQEKKPWDGIREANEESNVCVQPKTFGTINGPIVGQEDCLYLNVFAPTKLDIGLSKLATIVYIHGGGFQTGSASEFKPDYILDYNVILVTLNYRLGPFGFLGMNNDVITGNFGMKDQSLALKWVKENIEAFGGDNKNICLMGESAGAGSVHFHMFSPLSEGLFNKAIMQSGSAISPWAFYDEQYTQALSTTFAVVLGCYYKDPQKILRCLQSIPADDLSKAESRLYIWEVDPTVIFKVTIESNITHQPFLPVSPSKNSYVTKNIPWITGINSGEGIFKAIRYLSQEASLADIIDSNRRRFLPLLNQYLYTAESESLDEMTEKIINRYFSDKKIGKDTDLQLVNMFTDSLFTFPLIRSVLSSSGPRYVYYFDHEATYATNARSASYSKSLGVCHADEIPLLFYDEDIDKSMTPTDRNVSSILLEKWINFAITSDPNGHFKQKVWHPVETAAIEYLHIKSNVISMEKNLLKERYDFWDSLPLGKRYS